MKTVLVGLGKCGSRMAHDLGSLIYGGSYSYEIQASKNKKVLSPKGFWSRLLSSKKTSVQNIHADEVPVIHMGDCDNQNEVVAMCLTIPEGSEGKEEYRHTLADNLITFSNYNQACGQYHIIGEQVMRNLLQADAKIGKKILEPYIGKGSDSNVSVYMLAFGAGGGTGCGAATVLAEKVAARAREEYVNLLVGGLTALPRSTEADNYKISAGRFLTKFLASEHATSFDAVFTVSNTIMENQEQDEAQVGSMINIFAARLLCSLINSSSKYHRCPINTDGPELRKNIHGLAFFCYAQAPIVQDASNLVALDMLKRALSPIKVEESDSLDFQGSSIRFDDEKRFSRDQWEIMLSKIRSFREDLASDDMGRNTETLRKKAAELFRDQRDIPLPMRSAEDVVVLRGIPETGQSSSWEQTVLVTLLEALFPKARIHYYHTYHTMPHETLTIIPSNYLSYEILKLISLYLRKVWDVQDQEAIAKVLSSVEYDISPERVLELCGEREHFEKEKSDFLEIMHRVGGLFDMADSEWNEFYVTSEHVSNMLARVHNTFALLKRKPQEEEAAFLNSMEEL